MTGTPPRLAERFMGRVLHSAAQQNGVVGDLREEYVRRCARRNRFACDIWFWRQAILVYWRFRSELRRSKSVLPRGGISPLVGGLFLDVRFSIRALLRRPGFAFIAILTLGLGIGANTTMFSVLSGILLRPLPYADADQLVLVYRTDTGWRDSHDPMQRAWWDRLPVSFPVYNDWLELNRVFQDLGVYNRDEHKLSSGDRTESIVGAYVTSGVFVALAVPPVLGRTLVAGDDQVGARSLVVLSHGLWQRRFGSDSTVVGETIQVDEESYTIAGVMPPGFSFPSASELWMTFGDRDKQSGGYWLTAVARLRNGLPLGEAQREMELLADRIAEARAEERDCGVRVVSYMEAVVGNVRGALLLLLGAVGMVLLIACSNIANLLLVRATERHKELALRTALGAKRGRLAGLLLSESLALSIVGGAAGLLIAVVSLRPLVALLPPGVPRVAEIGVDYGVLAFCLLLSILTGLVVGVLPAFSGRRIVLSSALQGVGSSIAGSVQRNRLQATLVVSQIALTFVLLVGAGLLIRSFVRLTSVDPGFQRGNMLTFYVEPQGEQYDSKDRLRAFYFALSQRLESIPGVLAVTSSSQMPFADGTQLEPITAEGHVGEEPILVECSIVTSSYFRVMGIPIVEGRAFTEDEDRDPGTSATIVSQAMAERYWPEGPAVGRSIQVPDDDGESRWLTVVGVAGDVHHQGLSVQPQPKFYWPFSLRADDDQTYVLRTGVDPSMVVGAVQDAVWAIDPNTLLTHVGTLDGLIGESVVRPRFLAVLASALAALAALLAVVGIFGVLAHTVARRSHEFGIRMALGAKGVNVILSVLRRAIMLVGVGLAIGFGLALVAVRVLESTLFEVSPWDAPTLLGVALLLVTAAMSASWVPARRATRVDPIDVLRQE